jgi:DNA-binding beta-propeller fold protein YncE
MARIDTEVKVGKPGNQNWSGVFGYPPETDPLKKVFGSMFAVMSIRSEVDFDLTNLGGWLFDELQSAYFGEFKPAVELADFEKALHKVKTRVDTILEREAALAETGVDLEMAIAVVKGEVLYLAVVGESKIYIQREDNFAEVGSALIDGEMDGFMRTGSMYLTPGDSLLLATSDMANELDHVQSIMEKFDLDSAHVNRGAALMVGYDHPEGAHVKETAAAVEIAEKIDESALVEETGEVLAEEKPHAEKIDLGLAEESTEIGSEIDDELETEELETPKPVVAKVNEFDDGLDDDEEYEDEGPSFMENMKPKVDQAKLQAGVLFGKAKVGAAGLLAKISGKRQPGAIPGARSVAPAVRADLMEDEDELEFDDVHPAVRERQERAIAARASTTDHEMPARRVASQSTIQTFLANLVNSLKVNLLGLNGRSQMYLRGGRGKRNWKMLAVIGVVVAGVLFLGIRKVVLDRDYQSQVLGAQTGISDLNGRLDDLTTQVTTLSIGTQDPAAKAQTMTKLDALIADARELEDSKIFTSEAKLKSDTQNIISRARASQDQLANVVAFTQPQVVTDLGVNFQGVDVTKLTYSNGKVYVADKGRNVIYRMGTSLNSETTAFVNGLNAPYMLKAAPNGDLVVVDENADSAVATISIENGAVKRHTGLSKAKIGTLSAIDIWTNEALYSINPVKQALLKQENVAGNYSIPNDANPWRSDPDFANTIDLAVDYWVYTLVRGKGFTRYLGGQPDEFSFAGLMAADVAAIAQATAFDITATHLYVADPLNKRVLVFTKRTDDNKVLDFKQQFVYRGEGATFTKIKDIVANEETKKLYVLDGTQVIRLDL